MLFKAFIVGLIAVFGRLDSRMLGRLNFERPLITCTLVGLFLGGSVNWISRWSFYGNGKFRIYEYRGFWF